MNPVRVPVLLKIVKSNRHELIRYGMFKRRKENIFFTPPLRAEPWKLDPDAQGNTKQDPDP